MADFTAESRTVSPPLSRGGSDPLVTSTRKFAPSTKKFNLACFDNGNARHFWVSPLPTMADAPAGPTYVSATLVVIGRVTP